MAGKMSGDLVNKDRSTICQFRKENGLPTLSKSQSAKSVLVKSGRTPGQTSEQWWRDNWDGVVDTYWDKCSKLILAKMQGAQLSNTMIYYYLNHESSKKRSAQYARERWQKSKMNSLVRIKNKLRNHVYRICKKTKTKKHRKTSDYLGCSISHAKKHIEKQFKKGMNWQNHGTLWEIDHIIPLSAFELNRLDQQLIATHFTNLRPIYKLENRQKSSKITTTHQICFA